MTDNDNATNAKPEESVVEPSVDKPFYRSKKFWAASITSLLLILNDKMALGLTETTIQSVSGVAAAYVIGQGINDLGAKLKGFLKNL